VTHRIDLKSNNQAFARNPEIPNRNWGAGAKKSGRARERTEAEFRNLFDQSGFLLRRVIPAASTISIIEAAPTQ
jgi:hypothetical protein